MSSNRMKGGLPAPYNLKPASHKSKLTTPMKKTLAYICLICVFGFIIYQIAPKKEEEPEFELEKPGTRFADPADVNNNVF